MATGQVSSGAKLTGRRDDRRLFYRLRRQRYAEMLAESAESGIAARLALAQVLAERERQIEKLRADNAALRDLALRARADLENARKRMEREKEEIVKFANESLVRELISVVDNLERAIVSTQNSAEGKAIRQGVEMVLAQFVGILQANGVEVLEPDGEQFDPRFHEAVAIEEREDVKDNQIVETLQKGYVLRGRVVRPAMVRVGRMVRRVEAKPEEPVVAGTEETLADFDETEAKPAAGEAGEPEPAEAGEPAEAESAAPENSQPQQEQPPADEDKQRREEEAEEEQAPEDKNEGSN